MILRPWKCSKEIQGKEIGQFRSYASVYFFSEIFTPAEPQKPRKPQFVDAGDVP